MAGYLAEVKLLSQQDRFVTVVAVRPERLVVSFEPQSGMHLPEKFIGWPFSQNSADHTRV